MLHRGNDLPDLGRMVWRGMALCSLLAGITPAAAAPLVINEVDYDQPSTDTAEFIEIYNPGPATLDLSGYSLVLVNGNGGTIYSTIPFPSVSLAAGDYYVVCGNAGTTLNCDLDVSPDSDLIQNGAPDAVALLDPSQILIDALSYEGSVPGYTEGPGAIADDSSQADMGLSRCPNGADSDDNSLDFSLQAITPGAGNDCGIPKLVINEVDYDQVSTDAAEFIEIHNSGGSPVDLAGYSLVLVSGSSAAIYDTITLPSATLEAGGYYVVCANAATTANCDLDVIPDTNLIQNGAPDAVALLDPSQVLIDTLSYEGNVPGYTEGTGADADDPNAGDVGLSRCPDGTDSDDNSLDFGLRAITPGAENSCTPDIGACGDPATSVHDIQGSGAVSPLVSTQQTVEGIVVGDFQGASPQLGGFFLQEEDADADGNPLTSEGIFVFDDGFGVAVQPGDKVRVGGVVSEVSGMTQLTSITGLAVCDMGNNVTAAELSLPFATTDYPERFEGMAVILPQTLTVTENFELGRYGEILLSSSSRLWAPTSLVAPGTPANDLQALNDLNRLVLDDPEDSTNPDPIIYPDPELAAGNTLRAGDQVSGITGALQYGFDAWRVRPTAYPTFSAGNPRPVSPAPVAGPLTVGALNLLNYFTTISASPICGPAGNLDCRGADSVSEFNRQRDKLIATLLAMDGAIVGLVELENNASASIQDLVNGLNAIAGPGTYGFIDTGFIGTDAIKVGLIYQPARVTPLGSFQILDDSVDIGFLEDWNRPSLAQTFSENVTGERFTVVVNHFKSKGSPCDVIGDPDLGDGQGNCNLTRVAAATALVNWLQTDPTGSNDPDFLILGDLNAYAMEDPISTITAAGYVDLMQSYIGTEAYSYVFFGQSGYLDHALANIPMRNRVTGVTEWHTNADEPRVLDYNEEFKNADQLVDLYSADPFRAADHDPVLVGLDLSHCISVAGVVTIQDRTYPAGQKMTCSADISIATNLTVTVAAGADVTYLAPAIRLNANFGVQSGGAFRAGP